ncbi:MAG TPA: protease complex subunit PrcB family protein [Vicinamibacterales bacterium]|nr:protease complex subunit PrcB family protein [Vicinamibacterales bacterium]
MTAWVLALAMLTQPAPAPLQSIANDAISMVDAPKQAVARTEQEWAALWKSHALTDPPKVDLTKHMVVAVFLGARPSAGFNVQITGVRQKNGVLIVEYQERQPARDAMTAQMMTSPAHFAAVPRFGGDVRFQKVAP